MPSLSLIFEDTPEGDVIIKSRSTRQLTPDNLSPAEMIMVEVSGFVATNYTVNKEGIIQVGTILTPDKPKLIV